MNTSAASKTGKAAPVALILLILLALCNIAVINAMESSPETVGESPSPTDIAVSESELPADAEMTSATTADTTLAAVSTEPSETEKKDEKTENVSPYKIVVYIGSQSTVVYKVKEDGSLGSAVKRFSCSTGAPSSPTSPGEYMVQSKQRWCSLQGNVYGQFCSYIGAHYLFHSVPYLKRDPSSLENEEYDKLGRRSSMGCIRMCVRDCKWIFDNVPIGTPVIITKSSGPSGGSFPKRKKDRVYDGWDPSDRWAKGNPYFDSAAAQRIRDSLASQDADSTTSAATAATSVTSAASATSATSAASATSATAATSATSAVSSEPQG